ncbi:uncharacterized protein [Miscanthus floridulus]|uniref:uncharacterized protein n=1 Tax=Miscanthus floridulus TaxID=154761 RepID=UPI0034587EAD
MGDSTSWMWIHCLSDLDQLVVQRFWLVVSGSKVEWEPNGGEGALPFQLSNVCGFDDNFYRMSSTRRWRKVTAADSSPWASLHEDLVSLVGWRVLAGDFQDYILFRAVCRHWRSSTTCPRGHGIVDPRFYPRRWMMLPEGHCQRWAVNTRGLHPGHGKLRGYVRFFNLSTGAFVRVKLPLFKDHYVLYSVDDILLLRREHDTAIRLLHAFTGDTADFPPLETLSRYVRCRSEGEMWHFLRKICGASISVGADELVRVMMRPNQRTGICFATSGDQQWRVTTTWERSNLSSNLPFQGKLYVLLRAQTVRDERVVIQIDPPQQEGMDIGSLSVPSPKLVAKFKWPTSDTSYASFYYRLAECNSEILVIGTKWDAVCYSVYRLADLMLGRTVPLTPIDGNALFIGRRSLCVSSKVFPTIVPDTIVMRESKIYLSPWLSQYHLSNGTLSQATDGVIAEEKDIPGPYSIMCHIITCCSPPCWNKGKILCKEMAPKWRVKKKFRYGRTINPA